MYRRISLHHNVQKSSNKGELKSVHRLFGTRGNRDPGTCHSLPVLAHPHTPTRVHVHILFGKHRQQNGLLRLYIRRTSPCSPTPSAATEKVPVFEPRTLGRGDCERWLCWLGVAQALISGTRSTACSGTWTSTSRARAASRAIPPMPCSGTPAPTRSPTQVLTQPDVRDTGRGTDGPCPDKMYSPSQRVSLLLTNCWVVQLFSLHGAVSS